MITKSATLKTKMIQLTVAKATAFLKTLGPNRKLSESKVYQIADALERGEYIFNGDPLKFDIKGRMIDGQHRCAAVVESEVTIPVLIVTGLKPVAMETIDLHHRRSIANRLQIKGVSYPAEVGAIASLVFSYQNNLFTHRSAGKAPTPQQLFKLLKDEPGIHKAAAFASCNRVNFLTSRFVGFLHYRINQTEPQLWGRFWADLSTGVDLEAGNSVLVLRNTLMKARQTSGPRRVTPTRCLAICIKAWNAWVNDDSVKFLRWRRKASSAGKEAFPTMEGDEDYVVVDIEEDEVESC